MVRHFVYILKCSDGTLYTGYTTDPPRRVKEHNAGSGSRYTRSRLPVSLTYLEELASRSQALKREIRIKKLGKSGKLLLSSRYRRPARHSSR